MTRPSSVSSHLIYGAQVQDAYLSVFEQVFRVSVVGQAQQVGDYFNNLYRQGLRRVECLLKWNRFDFVRYMRRISSLHTLRIIVTKIGVSAISAPTYGKILDSSPDEYIHWPINTVTGRAIKIFGCGQFSAIYTQYPIMHLRQANRGCDILAISW